MSRFDLRGKVALVAGGNVGVGQGIARGLLECGATMMIAGRNDEKNKDAMAELSKIGPAVSAFAMDVTDEKQCQAAVSEVVPRYPPLPRLSHSSAHRKSRGVSGC
jgi:2-dehydro-3-deoxy-D-gluconate 5-dehydrogenase